MSQANPEATPQTEPAATEGSPFAATEHAEAEAGDLMRQEEKDWRAMPFLRLEDGEIADNWAPPEITGASDIYSAECAIGTHYALEALGHMRTYGDRCGDDFLLPVFQGMVERGKWGGVEIGFVASLDQYMARGHVNITGGFEVALPDAERRPRSPVGECDAEESSVAAVAMMLSRLWIDYARVDEAHVAWCHEDPKKSDERCGAPDRELEEIDAKIDEAEDRITNTPGKTLADALAQVILATTYTNSEEGRQLLHSVKNVLERETGLNGAMFAADKYMSYPSDSRGAETEKAVSKRSPLYSRIAKLELPIMQTDDAVQTFHEILDGAESKKHGLKDSDQTLRHLANQLTAAIADIKSQYYPLFEAAVGRDPEATETEKAA